MSSYFMDFCWSQSVPIQCKHSMGRLSCNGPATIRARLPRLCGVGLQSPTSPSEVCLHVVSPKNNRQIPLSAKFATFYLNTTSHSSSISGQLRPRALLSITQDSALSSVSLTLREMREPLMEVGLGVLKGARVWAASALLPRVPPSISYS